MFYAGLLSPDWIVLSGSRELNKFNVECCVDSELQWQLFYFKNLITFRWKSKRLAVERFRRGISVVTNQHECLACIIELIHHSPQKKCSDGRTKVLLDAFVCKYYVRSEHSVQLVKLLQCMSAMRFFLSLIVSRAFVSSLTRMHFQLRVFHESAGDDSFRHFVGER